MFWLFHIDCCFTQFAGPVSQIEMRKISGINAVSASAGLDIDVLVDEPNSSRVKAKLAASIMKYSARTRLDRTNK